LERAVLVLQEEYKKRIAKENKLKKYIKNMQLKGYVSKEDSKTQAR
jgi:hypothetical protein